MRERMQTEDDAQRQEGLPQLRFDACQEVYNGWRQNQDDDPTHG